MRRLGRSSHCPAPGSLSAPLSPARARIPLLLLRRRRPRRAPVHIPIDILSVKVPGELPPEFRSLDAGKPQIDDDDVQLAIQAKVNFSSSQPPPREFAISKCKVLLYHKKDQAQFLHNNVEHKVRGDQESTARSQDGGQNDVKSTSLSSWSYLDTSSISVSRCVVYGNKHPKHRGNTAIPSAFTARCRTISTHLFTQRRIPWNGLRAAASGSPSAFADTALRDLLPMRNSQLERDLMIMEHGQRIQAGHYQTG